MPTDGTPGTMPTEETPGSATRHRYTTRPIDVGNRSKDEEGNRNTRGTNQHTIDQKEALKMRTTKNKKHVPPERKHPPSFFHQHCSIELPSGSSSSSFHTTSIQRDENSIWESVKEQLLEYDRATVAMSSGTHDSDDDDNDDRQELLYFVSSRELKRMKTTTTAARQGDDTTTDNSIAARNAGSSNRDDTIDFHGDGISHDGDNAIQHRLRLTAAAASAAAPRTGKSSSVANPLPPPSWLADWTQNNIDVNTASSPSSTGITQELLAPSSQKKSSAAEVPTTESKNGADNTTKNNSKEHRVQRDEGKMSARRGDNNNHIIRKGHRAAAKGKEKFSGDDDDLEALPDDDEEEAEESVVSSKKCSSSSSSKPRSSSRRSSSASSLSSSSSSSSTYDDNSTNLRRSKRSTKFQAEEEEEEEERKQEEYEARPPQPEERNISIRDGDRRKTAEAQEVTPPKPALPRRTSRRSATTKTTTTTANISSRAQRKRKRCRVTTSSPGRRKSPRGPRNSSRVVTANTKRPKVTAAAAAAAAAATATTTTIKKTKKNISGWNEKYDRLVKYKKQNKSTCVPDSYPADPQLGRWVRHQRSFYNTNKSCLTADRITQLDSIGFVWNHFDAQWNEKYDRLVKYKKQNKTTCVPRSYPTDPKLGRWVRNQRSIYNTNTSRLTADRITQLDSIGFVWNLFDAYWIEMYDRLVKYKKQNKNTCVPNVYPADRQLGKWVNNQRTNYNTSRPSLAADRITQLDSIGFVWKIKDK